MTHTILRLPAYVSLGYKDSETWFAKGWWTVSPGECVSPKIGSKLAGDIYAYATTDTAGYGSTWVPEDGNANFCVDVRDAFTNPDSTCEGNHHADYQWARFGVVYRGGAGKFTWNLGG